VLVFHKEDIMTVSYKTVYGVIVSGSLVIMVALGLASRPLWASCLARACDESLFFHINGGEEYSAVHAPSPVGVYSIAGGGTRTDQESQIQQKELDIGVFLQLPAATS
jgi:hypothetical protein